MLFHPQTTYGSDRFRQIFIDHWHRWLDFHEEDIPADQRAYVRKTIQKMMGCRNPKSGYARYVCPGCGEERIVPFSCKSRFCPSCGKVHTDEWVNRIAQELLDVPHLHLTLTIAQELRQTFHADRRLLDTMLKVAAEAVRQVVGDEHPELRIGMIYTCHTFGRDLGFKPHVHLVTTKGGLDTDNNWVEIDGIPGGKLSVRWRYLLCKELRRLRPYDDALRMTIDDLYRRFRGFQVYTDSFYPRGLEAAKYIGRYLGHPPLATSHITQYDGQRLQFWYRETATGLRRAVNLSPLEFISLLVPHIPPKGTQLVRHAGLYARNVKAKWAEIANAALDALRLQMPLFDLQPFANFFKSLTWRERIKASFGYDPLECQKCGCIMELVEIWDPQRGHVWMKRWLETHRMRKAARDALSARLTARPVRLTQLAFAFDDTS